MPRAFNPYLRSSVSGFFPPGVKWLLIVNIAIFIFGFFLRSTVVGSFLSFLALVPRAVVDFFMFWQLATYMFLHGGLIHIGFNMMSLMQLGPALEEVYGSARYLFIYAFTGAFGFLVSAFTGHFSVGASGALLGLVGAMLAITTKRGGAYMQDLRSRLISSVVILFVLGFSGLAIDNWAHGGGLAAGFVLGKLLADRQPMNSKERRTAYVLGWLAGLAIVASFAIMLVHYHDPTPFSQ